MLLEQKGKPLDCKVPRSIHMIALALTMAATSACSSLKTAPVKTPMQAGFNVKKSVLKNGLTVLIAPNPKLPIVSYYTLFDVGGKDEGPGTTGATHFLEHMMFKGAKKYGPGEFDTLIERNGGMTNAFTTNDMTVYYQNIPKDFLPQMIDLEADRLQNLLLEPVSFESERKVIFEERKMRYENSPDGLIYLAMMKKMFEGTPYGQSVIGDEADLKALTRDQMMNFFKTYYVPNNAIVAITGDVDPDAVMKIVREKYEDIPSSTELIELKRKNEEQALFIPKAKLGTEYKLYATNPTPKFIVAYPAEKIGTRKAYVMDAVANILASGGSSYLVQKYVKSDDPLLQDIGAANYNLINGGVFYFQGELVEGKTIDALKGQLNDDLLTMCDSSINDRSLQKTKNQILAQGYNQLKTNAGVASTIVRNQKWHDDYNYGLKEMEIYNSLTTSEVLSTCKELLEGKPSIFLSVWDKYPKNPGTK